ncbi:MAG: DegT/DnrJ/EryC1/StrS family aminotransferase [Bdellovibrionales bacterium]|nr:DegT/DnrJ/EryC1/StrS family aminotransferase [Bdellovibrionales bacterium]
MINRFPLATDSFSEQERCAVDEVMKSGRYTMGEKVQEFEKAFADWVGAKHAVMVNSGSSANLLLVASMLYNSHGSLWERGDEVLVPALSWPTTVWPLAQLGLVPVFVDIDPNTLAIDLKSAQKALSAKTKGMFLIHVLGLSAQMDEVQSFCKTHNLVLLEDCCESFGSYFNQKHVGTFGKAGTFSHFFSHHLTTMEGGTLVTDDSDLANDWRSLRAHGWTRDRTDKETWHQKHPELDPRFHFILPGFNLRPMEVQAALGLVQLSRVELFLNQRDQVANCVFETTQTIPWLKMIGSEYRSNSSNDRRQRRHSWMNISFRLKENAPMSCEQVKAQLESQGVETRPIIAGNLTKHPACDRIEKRIVEDLSESDRLLESGFMIGCNPENSHSESLATLEKAFKSLEP